MMLHVPQKYKKPAEVQPVEVQLAEVQPAEVQLRDAICINDVACATKIYGTSWYTTVKGIASILQPTEVQLEVQQAEVQLEVQLAEVQPSEVQLSKA